MPRVATLTDQEYKILAAVREAMPLEPKTASAEIQHELDQINYELGNISGSNWEEVVQEVRRRVYGLLR
jgi:hypothetical protein